jgi:hypothetical protein
MAKEQKSENGRIARVSVMPCHARDSNSRMFTNQSFTAHRKLTAKIGNVIGCDQISS